MYGRTASSLRLFRPSRGVSVRYSSLSSKKSIDDVKSKLKGSRVLVRVDFNVPFDENGKIANDQRVKEALPTIQAILQEYPRSVVLMSHLGRPKGQRKERLSLNPVAALLKDLLGRDVLFLNDCVGDQVRKQCQDAASGSVILLENLRFHIEEEGKGEVNGEKVKADKNKVSQFRADLTALGDIYVNDAFGTSHRAHSSIVGIDLPDRIAGLLLQKELDYFSQALEFPKRPFLGILGGAKVADKIQLIKNLLDKVDELIIGGGMAYTFIKVLDNLRIGSSIFDEKGAALVSEIIQKARERNVKVHLPFDHVIAESLENPEDIRTVIDADGIPDGYFGLDIGPASSEKMASIAVNAKLIFWNGPMGMFEKEPFQNGTKSLLDAVCQATQLHGATSIIGGGDTATCVKLFGRENDVSHISTGGGASVELIEGKELPGITALCDKE